MKYKIMQSAFTPGPQSVFYTDCVESGKMGLTDDKILLPQTKMAPFGRGVAGDSLLQNLPGDAEVNFYTCLLSSELMLLQGLLNDAL